MEKPCDQTQTRLNSAAVLTNSTRHDEAASHDGARMHHLERRVVKFRKVCLKFKERKNGPARYTVATRAFPVEFT